MNKANRIYHTLRQLGHNMSIHVVPHIEAKLADPRGMDSIAERVQFLLDKDIAVWVRDSSGTKTAIKTIEKAGDKYFWMDYYGNKYGLPDDEGLYETVNYRAPLFH